MGLMKIKATCPNCGMELKPNVDTKILEADDGEKKEVKSGEALGCEACDFFVIKDELPGFKDMLKAKFKK